MSAFLFWLISSSAATEADGSTGHLGADLGSGAGEEECLRRHSHSWAGGGAEPVVAGTVDVLALAVHQCAAPPRAVWLAPVYPVSTGRVGHPGPCEGEDTGLPGRGSTGGHAAAARRGCGGRSSGCCGCCCCSCGGGGGGASTNCGGTDWLAGLAAHACVAVLAEGGAWAAAGGGGGGARAGATAGAEADTAVNVVTSLCGGGAAPGLALLH